MLLNQNGGHDGELGSVAVMFSWALYGASEEWKRHLHKTDPREFIKNAVPLLGESISI